MVVIMTTIDIDVSGLQVATVVVVHFLLVHVRRLVLELGGPDSGIRGPDSCALDEALCPFKRACPKSCRA